MALKEVKKPQELDQEGSQTNQALGRAGKIIVELVSQHLFESSKYHEFKKKDEKVADFLASPIFIARAVGLQQKGVTPTLENVTSPQERRQLTPAQLGLLGNGITSVLLPVALPISTVVSNMDDSASRTKAGDTKGAMASAEKANEGARELPSGVDGQKVLTESAQFAAQEHARGMSKSEKTEFITAFAAVFASVGLDLVAGELMKGFGLTSDVRQQQMKMQVQQIMMEYRQTMLDTLRKITDSFVRKETEGFEAKRGIPESERTELIKFGDELSRKFKRLLGAGAVTEGKMDEFHQVFSRVLDEELNRNKKLLETSKKFDENISLASLDTSLSSVLLKTYDTSLSKVYGVPKVKG